MLPAGSVLRRTRARGAAESLQGRSRNVMDTADRRHQLFAVATAFLALFAIVGFALYGLPRFYPFFVKELGWTRQQVTSGNAYSKILIALAFGFVAGRLVDKLGPRRLM